MIETTSFQIGWISGLFAGMGLMKMAWEHSDRRRGIAPPDHDWRRSFTHESTNRPSGPPPLKFRRRDDGYQPRPHGSTPNPPPSDP